MISNLLYVLLAIAILGVLVTVHEFGHYIVGRLTGLTVLEFSIGFGPKLLGWRRKEIDYSLRAIPLGGYCKLLGEDEANDDPRAMGRQAVWRRFVTILAGPVMNFLFAFVVAVVLISGYGVEDLSPTIAEVVPGMPAIEVGVAPGDLIVEVDGAAVADSAEGVEAVRDAILAAEDRRPVNFVVDREGARVGISMTPRRLEPGVYQIGISFSTVMRDASIFEALRLAPRAMLYNITETLKALKNLAFKGEGTEDVMGPVGIVSTVSKLARRGLYQVLNLLFFISMNLGLMNLLPLPALDGGRLIFLAAEGVRRKPVPPEKEGLVHGIGFMLLMGAILFFTYQDVMRWFAR